MTIRSAASRLGLSMGVGPIDPTGPSLTYRWPSVLNAATDANAAWLLDDFGGALDLCSWSLGNTDLTHFGNHLWTGPGAYNFTGTDQTYDWAIANGVKVFVNDPAYSGVPTWIVNGGFSAAQLTTMLHDYLEAVYARYPLAYASTLLNEFLPLTQGGTEPSGVGAPPQNGGYWCVEWWFQHASVGVPGGQTRLQFFKTIYDWVRGFNPRLKLVFNQHSSEDVIGGLASGADAATAHANADGLYYWMQQLIAQGVSIDAVGLQCHFFSAGDGTYDGAGFTAQIQRLNALGLEVILSEFDIRNDWSDWTQLHYDLIAAALAAKCVQGIAFWCPSDPLFYNAAGALYSGSRSGARVFVRTPAAQKVEDALNAAPTFLTLSSATRTSGGAYTIAGMRTSGATVTASSAATLGAVSYPSATTWQLDVTEATDAPAVITLSDGTSTIKRRAWAPAMLTWDGALSSGAAAGASQGASYQAAGRLTVAPVGPVVSGKLTLAGHRYPGSAVTVTEG